MLCSLHVDFQAFILMEILWFILLVSMTSMVGQIRFLQRYKLNDGKYKVARTL
jgi:hypothetical protein